MGSLASLVPSEERDTVTAVAGRLIQQAAAPEAAGPARDRMCQVIAAIAPTMPLHRLGLLVRYGLWSVALDDRLDGRDADPRRLAELQASVSAVLRGEPPSRRDPFLSELAGIMDSLCGYDRAGLHADRFGEALQDAVAASIEHAELGRAIASGAAPPPDATRYLAVAARTVNYHSFAHALLAAGGVAPSGPWLGQVSAAITHAAYAVRLGNDLRSVARDRAEATLNVLDLRTAAGAPVTPRQVTEEIDRRVRAHDEALAGIGDVAGSPAPLLARNLRLAVALYRITDLRVASEEQP